MVPPSVWCQTVNIFKTLRDRCWADVDETWYMYFMWRRTKLLGSVILNFDPGAGGEMTHNISLLIDCVCSKDCGSALCWCNGMIRTLLTYAFTKLCPNSNKKRQLQRKQSESDGECQPLKHGGQLGCNDYYSGASLARSVLIDKPCTQSL